MAGTVNRVNPDDGSCMCRHCHKYRITRPRFLCANCYYTDGLRDRYPPCGDPKFSGRGVGCNGGGKGLGEPTSGGPGSEGKIRAMEQRAAAGLSIWHPQDAGYNLG